MERKSRQYQNSIKKHVTHEHDTYLAQILLLLVFDEFGNRAARIYIYLYSL